MSTRTISTKLTMDTSEFQQGVKAAGQALEAHQKGLELTARELEALNSAVKQAKAEYELLVKAEKEVQEAGSISVKTLSTLLDKYPELQKYLEATADGYVLTQGALEDYIETQRAEYQAIYDNAERAAQAVIDNEALEAAGYDATTTSIKAKLQALMEMYKLEASTIQNSTLTEYGDNALGRHISVSASRQAVSNMQAAQTALANLEAAEKQLDAYTRASAMLARDYGSSSSTKSSSGSSSSKSTAKAAEETAMEALQEWLDDMDHQIFLWSKDESKTDAIVELYQQMQDKVHAMAEEFRAAGYEETSGEIQNLQKLWWGYSDKTGGLRQDMYKRDLAALEAALENEGITWEDYLKGWLEVQNKYLTEGSDAWQQAGEERQQAIAQHAKDLQKQREGAYDEALADLDYFLDMDLISEEEYWQKRIALAETYLTEDSEKRRQAEVAIYQYVKQLREQMQKESASALSELEKNYKAQVSALESALKEETSALAASYKADQQAQAELYKARKETLAKAYTEEKQILSDWYKEQKQALSNGYKEQKQALSDGYKAQKAAAKAAYEEKKAAIQAELDLEKERLNAILDGINQEIQARKELREDGDLDAAVLRAQKSLDAAKAELAFARTGEDRAEWEKEVIRRQEALEQALQNREDTLFYREKELEKQAVQDELSELQDAAKKAQEQAQAGYQATLEGLESGYNAALQGLENGYNTALQELEDSYTARLDGIETRHEAALEQLERGYNDMLARLEDQYNASLRRMESENALQLERLQARYETEVEEEQQRLIAALGYAEDSYQEALARLQSNCMAAMESAQSTYLDSLSTLARDAGAVMSRVENETVSYIQNVNRISTQNYKSAAINVYEAGSMTEGEYNRLLMKAVNTMDR